MRFNDKMVKIVCAVLAVAIALPVIIGAISMLN